MTDDGFVFGDNTDESEEVDESELLGAHPSESRSEAAETERRFGMSATDDADSRGFTKRVQSMTGDGIARTAATATLTVAVMVAFGLVAYPFAMGALDGLDDTSGGADVTTGNSGGLGGSTVSPPLRPMTETMVEQSAGATAAAANGTETETGTTSAATGATATTPTRTNRTPTATPTEGTTTPLPTKGFPAGDPAGENESADEGG